MYSPSKIFCPPRKNVTLNEGNRNSGKCLNIFITVFKVEVSKKKNECTVDFMRNRKDENQFVLFEAKVSECVTVP